MLSKKTIVVLTSRENFIWTSMQEIIPMIENVWKFLCDKHNFEYILLDVDKTSPVKNIHSLLKSDLIVVTCFNTKISRFLKITREKFQIDTRIFFYLHGLATIALWPLHRFEVLKLMNSADLFIASCEGDINSMQISFFNAKTIKVPFIILDMPKIICNNNKTRPFVYIGRISPQKNLEILIRTYARLEDEIKENHPLIFFGEEDHLGVPNIGIEEKSYLLKLKNLVTELHLNEFIFFKGFVNRLEIQKELGGNYIFVSPSTHSDENFGMAALRALQSGVPCILTAWGGHNEFANLYPSQIHFLKPYLTTTGCEIEISDFLNAMISSIADINIQVINPKFTFENIEIILKKAIDCTISSQETLEPTPLALSVFKQQKFFESKNKMQQCFESYTDPAFILFFEAYSKIIA